MKYDLSELSLPMLILGAALFYCLEIYLDHKKEMALLHCAPLTKHTTLSSAKKQVEINQGKIVE